MITADAATLASFWEHARSEHPDLTPEVPGAWAFGATAAHADNLLALVLAGTKTGTASLLWDYEARPLTPRARTSRARRPSRRSRS